MHVYELLVSVGNYIYKYIRRVIIRACDMKWIQEKSDIREKQRKDRLNFIPKNNLIHTYADDDDYNDGTNGTLAICVYKRADDDD